MTVAQSKNEGLAYRLVDRLLRYGLRKARPSRTLEKIALWWGYRFRPQRTIANLRSGSRIFVDPTDHLQLLIYYLGTFEHHCLAYLKACTPNGGTVVDVGANIGFYTLESARAVGPTGRVISIEAAPAHAAALRENLRLNNIANVLLIEVGVWDVPGEAILSCQKGGNLGMYTLGSTGGPGRVVTTKRIDDLLQEQGIQSVDLLKMDIEGSEYRALRGATKILKDYRPSILIELNESALRMCGSSCNDVKKLLREAGYQGWILRPKKVIAIIDDAMIHDCDECLFIHSGRQDLISRLRLPARTLH